MHERVPAGTREAAVTDSSTYPDAWAVQLASREQREVIDAAHCQCQLNYHGCTRCAVTTSATVDSDPVSAQRAACQACAQKRERARR
jgi:hypothetical protein